MDMASNPYTPLAGSAGQPSYQRKRVVRAVGLAAGGLLFGGMAVYATSTMSASPHTGSLESMSSGASGAQKATVTPREALADPDDAAPTGYVPMFTSAISSIFGGASSSLSSAQVNNHQCVTSPHATVRNPRIAMYHALHQPTQMHGTVFAPPSPPRTRASRAAVPLLTLPSGGAGRLGGHHPS